MKSTKADDALQLVDGATDAEVRDRADEVIDDDSTVDDSAGLVVDWIGTFKPQPHQLRCMVSSALYRWFCAGRGAGKTWTMCNDGLLTAICDPGGQSAIFGRVGNDIRATIEPELERQLAQLTEATGVNWVRKRNRSQLAYFRLINGHTIWLRPFDKIDQLRGFRVGYCGVDEMLWTYSVSEQTAWDQIRLLTTLPCKRPGVLVASSPNGLTPMTREFVEAQKRGDSQYSVTRAIATDNAHLSRTALEALMRGMSNRARRQEIFAEILRSANSVFAEFDEARHLVDFKRRTAVRNNWEWILAVDWNTSALAIYIEPKSYRWIVADEIAVRDTNERKISHDRFWAQLQPFVERQGRKPAFAACDRALPRHNAKLAQKLGVAADWSRATEEQSVEAGVEELRDLLDPHDSDPRIVFAKSLMRDKPEDQRVAPIIAAMRDYRYLVDRYGNITTTPKKDDVNDHATDALMYAVKAANRRWQSLLGGVVRPRAFTTPARRGIVQRIR